MNWGINTIVPAWNSDAWKTISGVPVINGDGITLPVGSTLRLRLDSGLAVVGASGLRVKVVFNGTFDDMSEYIPKSSINIRITYTDNTKQNIVLMFNKHRPEGENFMDITELTTPSKSVKIMDVYFVNSAESLGPIIIDYVVIVKSIDVSSEQVAGAVESNVSLAKLTSYDNGCLVDWKGDTESLKLEFIEGGSGEFLGIMVNDEDFIQYSRVAGLLPVKEVET